MRPPRTFHIRELINRSETINASGMLLQKDAVVNITKEIADVLAYMLELEHELVELRTKISENTLLEIELVGKDF